MKKIVLILALLMWGASFAQDVDSKLYGTGAMPFNDAGEVVFSKVISADGYTADQLYTAVRIYIAEAFKSANDVIQMDDKENKVLIAKGWRAQKAQSKFMNAASEVPYEVHFTMKFQCRDGRYKLDLYQLKGHKRAHGGLAEVNVLAEALTDDACIKPNGAVKTSGYGFWRRLVIDSAYASFAQAEEGVKRNLSGGSSDDEEW